MKLKLNCYLKEVGISKGSFLSLIVFFNLLFFQKILQNRLIVDHEVPNRAKNEKNERYRKIITFFIQ